MWRCARCALCVHSTGSSRLAAPTCALPAAAAARGAIVASISPLVAPAAPCCTGDTTAAHIAPITTAAAVAAAGCACATPVRADGGAGWPRTGPRVGDAGRAGEPWRVAQPNRGGGIGRRHGRHAGSGAGVAALFAAVRREPGRGMRGGCSPPSLPAATLLLLPPEVTRPAEAKWRYRRPLTAGTSGAREGGEDVERGRGEGHTPHGYVGRLTGRPTDPLLRPLADPCQTPPPVEPGWPRPRRADPRPAMRQRRRWRRRRRRREPRR